MLAKKFTATTIALMLALVTGVAPSFAAANQTTIQPFKCGDGVQVDITGGPTKFNTPTDRGFNFSNTLIGLKIDEHAGTGKGGAIIVPVGEGGQYVNDFQQFEVLVAKLTKKTWVNLGNELGFLFCVDYNRGSGSAFFKAKELQSANLGAFYTRFRLSKEQLRQRLEQQGMLGVPSDQISVERVVIVYKCPGGGLLGKLEPTVKHLLIGRILFVNKNGGGGGNDYLQYIYPDALLLPPIEDCDADENCYEKNPE